MAKAFYIETARVTGLSWGDYCNGQPATWVELDNGERVKVRGDMADTAARLNESKPERKEQP